MNPPPVPIMTVLDIGVDALLGGSHGYLHVPAGGYLNVTWLTKKECYRLTIDVTAAHPLDDAAESFNAETRRKIEQFGNLLDSIGLTDKVDKERLTQALMIVKDLGAPLPAEPTPNGEPRKPEPASDAQLAFISKLVKDKQAQAPDLPLTKAEAHEIIDTLQAGTYDYAKWHVAF